MPTHEEQSAEVDANWDAFQALLPPLLETDRDRYALMRSREVVTILDKPGDAMREGWKRFGDTPFSVQKITDEVIDLGWFSHVVGVQ